MSDTETNKTEPKSYVNEAYSESCENYGNSLNELDRNEKTKPCTPEYSSEERTRIKKSILKNILCISFSFTLLFTSFNSLSNLQSTLFKELGTRSLGIIYAGLILSCFFVPTFALKKLKPKWVVCLSMLFYSPYFTSVFYPSYYTFFPFAFILGLAGAPLWIAKCTYLSKIAEKYGEVVGESFDVVVVRFFGIFFFSFQSSQVLGNLLSSAVLSVGVTNFTRSEEYLQTCGMNYCPVAQTVDENVQNNSNVIMSNDTVTSSPEDPYESQKTKIYIMATIYLLLALSAVAFVAFVVDPLSKYGIEIGKPSMKAVFATVRHMKKPYQILIIPLTIWSGIEQGLLSADYTAAFVSCGIGVHMVGYVLICYGVTNAVCSYSFTPLIKYVKRVPIFTFGALVNTAMLIVMFTWMPNPDNIVVFFILASFWGAADAVWQTQINAFYGVIFAGDAEAAFSNYRLWESCGFIISYIISGSLCMRVKLWITLFSLALGMTGYYTIEFLESRKNRGEKTK